MKIQKRKRKSAKHLSEQYLKNLPKMYYAFGYFGEIIFDNMGEVVIKNFKHNQGEMKVKRKDGYGYEFLPFQSN
jgi:hypothetical protein